LTVAINFFVLSFYYLCSSILAFISVSLEKEKLESWFDGKFGDYQLAGGGLLA
jgi:hypothetical protein